MLGASVAFLVGRVARRSLSIPSISGRRLRFLVDRLNSFLENEAESVQLKAWFTIRLLTNPLFDPICYAAGLTGTRFRAFFWGTLLGNIPSMALFYLIAKTTLADGAWIFAASTTLFFALLWTAATNCLKYADGGVE